MSTTINIPDINIHNRAQVTASGSDEVLVTDASDDFKLKKVSVSSIVSGGGGGSGDVEGPASATDNAIARFDGTTGKLIQNSAVTIADTSGNMSGVGTISSGEITSSSLTASRVLVAGASKEVQSSSVTTTTLGYLDATSSIQTQLNTLTSSVSSASQTAAIGGTVTSGTTGSVLFVGAGPVFAQNNSNFKWDEASTRLQIGSVAPLANIHVTATSAATVASVFRGAAAQTANLTSWQNSAGTVLSAIESGGGFKGPEIALGGVSLGSNVIYAFRSTTTAGNSTNTTIQHSSSASASGIQSALSIISSNSATLSSILGIKLNVASSAGTVGDARALSMSLTISDTAVCTFIRAAYYVCSYTSSGNATTMTLLDTFQSHTGTGNITVRTVVNITTASGAGPGIITTQYGMRLQNQGAANITMAYGLFVDATTGATNNYTASIAGPVGINNTTPTHSLDLKTTNASTKGIVVRATASQTANLQEWQNSSATVLASVSANGKMNMTASTTTEASMNIPSGTAPSSPVNGDIWSDGTDLKLRLGGTTYTIQKV